ncbi:alpha/beta fold hydrolase [Fulvivirga sp. RKSG066]|uniref:proline iminopeptidase-family hydrolase n=1 Tax=Fulvivirga aurantia TaxID=2529383 RepID=UPI0012BB5E40|nr:proline iminopeptidase-family hydrolase [Fulvivirga aurantia]MTI22330.1 alpha/beta fold hydrolase [Fulvivirga aurantia]
MKYLLIALALIFCACQNQPITDEGFIEVKGGKIWYKVLNPEAEAAPVMIVHGGPGSRSCNTIEGYSLLAEHRPVILFDQLESGLSDHPNDTTLWKLPYFVDQVEAVANHLQLDQYHLLGNSWGGAIVAEYMLTKETKNVASVIFSGPLLSTPRWIEDAKVLLSRLSQPVQDTIKKYEALEEYNNPYYLAATDTFYANFLSRKQWPPQSYTACDTVPGFNSKIYNYMWGPTEFTATGTLQDFDRIDQLHKIEKPTLFIAGEYDEVLPETLELFQSKVKDSEVAIVSNAGHSKTTDNPEEFAEKLESFMSNVE